MPPLTLEQVLARSMRLPRKHVTRAAPFGANQTTFDTPLPSHATTVQGDKSVAKLFGLIEKDEEAVAASRPSIHNSHNLVRNSQDLLTYLHAAKRMHAWEDALRSFSESTGVLMAEHVDDRSGISLTLVEKADSTVGSDGVTPNVAHLTVLLETCAAARQWQLVEQLGYIFRKQSPKTLIDAVSLLANTTETGVTEGFHGWKRAVHFLQTRILPEEQPVEAYNVCLAVCEKTLDWESAFAIVRSMGPNPLQQMEPNSPSPGEEGNTVTLTAVANEASSPPVEATDEEDITPPHPPKPDVVTYATLISVLEQSGKDALAREVLQRLPSIEKEEITATYAALIHVWSEQKYRSHRRRF